MNTRNSSQANITYTIQYQKYRGNLRCHCLLADPTADLAKQSMSTFELSQLILS